LFTGCQTIIWLARGAAALGAERTAGRREACTFTEEVRVAAGATEADFIMMDMVGLCLGVLSLGV